MPAEGMLDGTARPGGGPGPDNITRNKLRSARARMREARLALSFAGPEEISGCVRLLEEAVACLRALPPATDRGMKTDPEMAREWEAVRFEWGIVRRLIEGGGQFYQGWARILAAASGYTPSGEPVALTAPGSVSLKG
jgi:hypothetical protein